MERHMLFEIRINGVSGECSITALNIQDAVDKLSKSHKSGVFKYIKDIEYEPEMEEEGIKEKI